jgi:two-component system chemotaxis response regulator CheY
MKVLLVDDSRTMRGIQKRILCGLENVQFVEAGDGLQALSAIAAEPIGFDLVLVDWNMPNMDGITFVRRVRERDRHTPVVMATTESDKAHVLEAIKAGVNNYVVKPFTPETLLDKVKQTLARARSAPLVKA